MNKKLRFLFKLDLLMYLFLILGYLVNTTGWLIGCESLKIIGLVIIQLACIALLFIFAIIFKVKKERD